MDRVVTSATEPPGAGAPNDSSSRAVPLSTSANTSLPSTVWTSPIAPVVRSTRRESSRRRPPGRAYRSRRRLPSRPPGERRSPRRRRWCRSVSRATASAEHPAVAHDPDRLRAGEARREQVGDGGRERRGRGVRPEAAMLPMATTGSASPVDVARARTTRKPALATQARRVRSTPPETGDAREKRRVRLSPRQAAAKLPEARVRPVGLAPPLRQVRRSRPARPRSLAEARLPRRGDASRTRAHRDPVEDRAPARSAARTLAHAGAPLLGRPQRAFHEPHRHAGVERLDSGQLSPPCHR